MPQSTCSLRGRLSAAVLTTVFACLAAPLFLAPLPACAVEAKPADQEILQQAALGDAVQLKALLARGGNPDAVNSTGGSALWVALGSRNVAAVEALLDAGAKGLNTPVHLQPGSYALAGLNSPVHLRRDLELTLLGAATSRGQADMVRMLLKHGADPLWIDNRQTDILYQTVRWEGADVETLKAFLDSGISLDRRFKGRQTYLIAAALTGKPEFVQLLLDRKADPNGRGDSGLTALLIAVADGREDLVRILLDHGAAPDLFYADGTSALTNTAAIKDAAVRERIRQMLLAKGAPKEDKNRPVDTLFLNAVRKGDVAAAEQALQQGADLDVRDAGLLGYGRTALDEAVQHPAMVKFLLDKGTNVHAWCGAKTTALHSAAGGGAAESIRLLVEHGLDVNVRNKYGSTPLPFAIGPSRKNKAEVVSLLLQLGADPNGKMTANETYLAYARRKGMTDIEALLVNAGAK